ncbi:WhiB family transcriptional regulator [Rhodococcus qingshengii]|uniref:WhiB family transcriptional regulator n=1 Tax=Rhodococcus qingshengii TaxID=334542 RepID=UPI0035D59392
MSNDLMWRHLAKCAANPDAFDTANLPKESIPRANAAKKLCAGCPAFVGCVRDAARQAPVGIVMAGVAFSESASIRGRQRRNLAAKHGVSEPEKTAA